jgi:hypothetical protein
MNATVCDPPLVDKRDALPYANFGGHVARIQGQLGPCVLLGIPRREKGPRVPGWQKLTMADMTPAYLAGLNHGQNMGVSLGAVSRGLCTIDADNDDYLEEFLELNPDFVESLVSRGARGGNVWLRIKGQYPPAGKLTLNGKPWGEWRADGNQTVIFGEHPSGCEYRNNRRKPLEIEFEGIKWPGGLTLPWETPEATISDPLQDCIILPSGPLGLYESAARAFRILARSEELFVRGGRVFQIVSSEDGLLRLDVVSEQALRSLIDRHGRVVAYRKGSHGEQLVKEVARCSLDTANAWLASDAKNELRPIAAIHGCPILTKAEDRPKVLGKGYHRDCGGRLVTGGEMPPKMELPDATKLLLDSLAEYDFATPADKSRAIACLITPALRLGGLLEAHLPLFVIEADESQAGKGFLLEQSQVVYREPASIIAQRQGGVGGLDESLAQALITGRPFIMFDNIRGKIGSPYFESVLTCPLGSTVPARVPYHGEVQVRPDRFIFQLTSNGFETTRDLANRSCIIRIRKRRGFAFRRYPEGNLHSHIAANQAQYLGAVYCVVAQWVARGKPHTEDTRGEGRFRQWAQDLDWIVQEIFGLPPLMEGHEVAQERAANPALNWLREVCLAAEADTRLGESLTASEIVEICQDHSLDIPGLASDALEEKAKMRVGAIMGKVFKQRDSIDCDGFQIRRTEATQHSEERRREITMRTYAISQVAHHSAPQT